MSTEEIKTAYEAGRGAVEGLKPPVREHQDKLHLYISQLQTRGADPNQPHYKDDINWWKDEIKSVRLVGDAFDIAKDTLHNQELAAISGAPQTTTGGAGGGS